MRAQTDEAMRECEQAGAVLYTDEEVNTFMKQRRAQRDIGSLKRAS